MKNNEKIKMPLRVFLIIAASFIFALNISTFVHSANLFPGGFSGLALLIQKTFENFFGIHLPYSVIVYAFNIFPVIIGFKYIGKKFTILSVVLILISGLLTDLLPNIYITDDLILCAVFGGVINAVAVSLCLFAESSSGGTDFIAIFIAEKTGRSSWNIIFGFNVCVLIVAGFLFGWDAALYSIIFQFASTQALNFFYKKYSKTTLFIITDKDEEIYEIIKELTNHDATIFTGKGAYSGKEKKLLYTVVSTTETGRLEKAIRLVDPEAFINVMQSKEIIGRFFKRAND